MLSIVLLSCCAAPLYSFAVSVRQQGRQFVITRLIHCRIASPFDFLSPPWARIVFRWQVLAWCSAFLVVQTLSFSWFVYGHNYVNFLHFGLAQFVLHPLRQLLSILSLDHSGGYMGSLANAVMAVTSHARIRWMQEEKKNCGPTSKRRAPPHNVLLFAKGVYAGCLVDWATNFFCAVATRTVLHCCATCGSSKRLQKAAASVAVVVTSCFTYAITCHLDRVAYESSLYSTQTVADAPNSELHVRGSFLLHVIVDAIPRIIALWIGKPSTKRDQKKRENVIASN